MAFAETGQRPIRQAALRMLFLGPFFFLVYGSTNWTCLVYIHCALGYSRSACIIAACLIKMKIAETVNEAVRMIKEAKPKIVLDERHFNLLRTYKAEVTDNRIEPLLET